MFKRYILAAMLILPWVAPAHGATVTSATKLVDKSGNGSITIVSAVTAPPSKKGTVIYDCGSTAAPFVYGVGSKAACPVVVVQAPWNPKAPIVTKSCVATLSALSSNGTGGNPNTWTFASTAGSYGDYCSTKAGDLIALGKPDVGPRVFHDIVATGNRHFLTTKPKATTVRADNVTIERIEASAYKRGVYIRGGSTNWLIQDFKIWTTSVNTSPGDVPVGIGIMGGHNIVMRRGEVWGFKSQFNGGFMNGDCISAKRGDSIELYDVVLHDCTDAGLDSKATTKLDRVYSYSNGRWGYKFWSDVTFGTITANGPIAIFSNGAVVVGDKLIAEGTKPLIYIDGNVAAGYKQNGVKAHVTIAACDLTRWGGTTLVGGVPSYAVITLGPTCKK